MHGLPVETWLDVCLSDIHAAVEASLPQMEGSRLEARDVLSRILGYTPPPELLETLKQVAEAPEHSALRMGLGRLLIALAILIQRELRALTEPRVLDPEMLRRQAETLPALIHRIKVLEDDIRSMRLEGHTETDRLRKLRVSLIPPVTRLQGFATLVPRVHRLASAAAEGSLDEVDALSRVERGWFEKAIGKGRQPGAPAPRALLDAVALRLGLAQDLEAHWRGESVTEQLRLDVAAYDLVVERLQQEEDQARARGQARLARRLSLARHELLRLHRWLADILGGVRRAGSAAHRQREGGSSSRSRAALLTSAAVLGIAAAVTLGFLQREAPSATEDPPSGPPTRERPRPGGELRFTHVEEKGDALVAEITAFSWRRMSPEERRERVYGLGLLAFRKGLSEVRVLDGSRRELASWSRDGSIRILSP